MGLVDAGRRPPPPAGAGEQFARALDAYGAGRCVSAGLVCLVGAAIALARRVVVRRGGVVD